MLTFTWLNANTPEATFARGLEKTEPIEYRTKLSYSFTIFSEGTNQGSSVSFVNQATGKPGFTIHNGSIVASKSGISLTGVSGN